MAKKKKQQNDKRITVNQAYKQMQRMCEQLETVVLQTLNKEFGFGELRKERFMSAFHREMNVYLMQQEKELRRQRG